MPFTPISALEIVLGSFAFIITTTLAMAVYLKNPNSWTSRFFVLLAIVIDAYIILNPISLHPLVHSPDNQLFWIRIIMFTVSFMTPILFLLVHTFPRNYITLSKPKLITVLAVMFAAAAISLTPLVFQSISYPQGKPVLQPGVGMPFFLLNFVGAILLSFTTLLYKYKKVIGLEKVKTAYFVAGIVITFTLMTISTVILVVAAQTAAGVFLGPIYPVILMSFIAYAIIRHQFLDIQPIIARAVSYAILTLFLAIIYATALYTVSSFITKITLAPSTLILVVILTTIITLTFQPLHAAIRKFTDRIFFKDLYDPEKLISDLTHIMASTLDLDELSNRTLDILMKEMRITKAAFAFIGHHEVVDVKTNGYERVKLLSLIKSGLDTVLHKNLQSDTHSMVLAELNDEEVKNLFRKYEIEALLPIKVDNEEIASLLLGPKASGDLYSRRDLKVLDIFASGAGLAVKNAQLYTDLQVASESKSRFVSVVSHQLRTPVSGIRWSLEMVQQEKIDAKEQKLFLDNAYQGAIFLGEQLDDILTALDIYDKKIFIKKDTCNLYEIVKDSINEFLNLMKSKKLIVNYKIDDDVRKMQADYAKLKKVIKIIIKNSFTYSPSAGKINITAAIDNTIGKKRIIITVSDEGIGITESERDHVFEEFFRSDKARTALPNGLGVGMFIAQAFIKAHGGEIWFYSAGRNRGTDFHIALPLE